MNPLPRLPKLRPVELAGPQRELYDAITAGPRARGRQAFALTDEDGGLEGPFNAMLLSPRLGTALQALGSAVRYQTALSDRAREMAILVVAHQWRSDFEIYAHEAVAAQAGLSADELAALRDGQLDTIADDFERLVAQTTAALATNADLDDAAYAAAHSLGETILFEVTTLVGYYAMLALQLRVYRVAAPGGGDS